MARTDTNRALSELVGLITAVVVTAALYYARAVFVPLALAVLFAFMLTPLVRAFDRMRFPRAVSALIVVAFSFAILGVVSWVITTQLVDVANQLPAYRTNIRAKLEILHNTKNATFNRASQSVSEIKNEILSPPPAPDQPPERPSRRQQQSAASIAENNARPTPVRIVPNSGSLESLTSFIGPATTFGMVTVFTFFMLLRREDLRNRFLRLVGHNYLTAMTQALDDASGRVSRFLLLQAAVNATYGLLVGLALYAIGLPHAFLWGAMATLLRFVPYVGFFLSAVMPVLLSVAMFDRWIYVLLTIGLYIALELIFANFVEPLLYSAQVGLSSMAILVAAVFWTVLWGPIGLVLSTPLTLCLVVIGTYVPHLKFFNILLGDEPVLTPDLHFYQRLLASDQREARVVLERYLKDHSRQELFDQVLIPALSLATQDRHRNDLDPATQQYVFMSAKELVEELCDKGEDPGKTRCREDALEDTNAQVQQPVPRSIVCVPANDDADEIVATMLAQLLECSGHQAQSVPVGSVSEMATTVDEINSDMVCISALPPFAIAHARNLYLQLRARRPERKILIGLWSFSGDGTTMANRLRLRSSDQVVISLEQAIAATGETEAPVHQEETSLLPGPGAAMS